MNSRYRTWFVSMFACLVWWSYGAAAQAQCDPGYGACSNNPGRCCRTGSLCCAPAYGGGCCDSAHPYCSTDGQCYATPQGGGGGGGGGCSSGQYACGDYCVDSGRVCCSNVGRADQSCPSGTYCASSSTTSSGVTCMTSGGGGGGSGGSGSGGGGSSGGGSSGGGSSGGGSGYASRGCNVTGHPVGSTGKPLVGLLGLAMMVTALRRRGRESK